MERNGFLVCKKIKDIDGLAAIPWVMFSADANAAEIFEPHKRLRTRAQAYVRKPVQFEEVLAVARQFIGIVAISPKRGIEDVRQD